MFDPSFFELIVICVVALLVLGPDKLPGAIKTLGLWIGRLRRSFNNIKREIEQEVGADEIRRQLRNEAIMEKFNSTKNQVNQSIQSVKDEAKSLKNDLDLTGELSDSPEDNKDKTTGSDQNEIDPVEKLATNDPAARIINP
jgi:sec-independent protein translocase protein TatB